MNELNESLNHWIIESLSHWSHWLNHWMSWVIEWMSWIIDWFVLISFTSPVLNGIIGRLLGYRYMWLCSGLLYMLCILFTPICALTIGKPEWVESSLHSLNHRPNGSSFTSFMHVPLFFESSSLLPSSSSLPTFPSPISEARSTASARFVPLQEDSSFKSKRRMRNRDPRSRRTCIRGVWSTAIPGHSTSGLFSM